MTIGMPQNYIYNQLERTSEGEFPKFEGAFPTEVAVIDVGTGDASLTVCFFDVVNQMVIEIAKFKDLSRDPEDLKNEIKKINPNLKVYVNLTKWARDLVKKDENDPLIESFKAIETVFANTVVETLSQPKEAKYSHNSLKHVAKFYNPSLGVTPENCDQIEAGKGSTQGGSMLVEQEVERAGKWAEDRFKEGYTLHAVACRYEGDILNDLDIDALKGVENLFMQGIFSVALNSIDLPEGMKKEDWLSGQACLSSEYVRECLKSKIDLLDEKVSQSIEGALKNKEKSAPQVLALGMLNAIKMLYGKNFNIFNTNKQAPLYLDGKKTGYEVKISGSHGCAVEYFMNIQKEARLKAESAQSELVGESKGPSDDVATAKKTAKTAKTVREKASQWEKKNQPEQERREFPKKFKYGSNARKIN